MWLLLRISDAFVVHFRLKLLANSSCVISYVLGDDRSATLCSSPAFQLQLFSCHGREFSAKLIKASLNFTYRWLVWLIPLEAKCFASIVLSEGMHRVLFKCFGCHVKKLNSYFQELSWHSALEQLSRKCRGMLRLKVTFTVLIQF